MPAYYSLPFLFLAMVPLGTQACLAVQWTTVPALLILFIVLDMALGRSPLAVPGSSPFAYRALNWLYICAQLAVTVWGAIVVGNEPSLSRLFALAVATGTAAGVFGILAAHEMIHSTRRVERGLGIIMLASITYTHFRISHIHGHHRLAATVSDPATARRGESVYHFVCRSFAGQLRDAWRHEWRRTAILQQPLAANRMIRYGAAEAGIYVGAALMIGTRAAIFLATQSMIAILILEMFNFIAHYGLLRRPLADGRLEPLGPIHSWNTARRFNNWALFNGGNHSDHHRTPTLAYQRLRAIPAAPELPCGYAGAIFLALITPLWRKVMDRRLMRWHVARQSRLLPEFGQPRYGDPAA